MERLESADSQHSISATAEAHWSQFGFSVPWHHNWMLMLVANIHMQDTRPPDLQIHDLLTSIQGWDTRKQVFVGKNPCSSLIKLSTQNVSPLRCLLSNSSRTNAQSWFQSWKKLCKSNGITLWKNNVLFVHGRTDNTQFLPCWPNFGPSIFVDQANLRGVIVGNAVQWWWNTDPVFRES